MALVRALLKRNLSDVTVILAHQFISSREIYHIEAGCPQVVWLLTKWNGEKESV